MRWWFHHKEGAHSHDLKVHSQPPQPLQPAVVLETCPRSLPPAVRYLHKLAEELFAQSDTGVVCLHSASTGVVGERLQDDDNMVVSVYQLLRAKCPALRKIDVSVEASVRCHSGSFQLFAPEPSWVIQQSPPC